MPDEQLVFLYSGVFSFVVIAFIGIIIAVTIVKKFRNQKTQQQYAEKYRARNEASQTTKTQQTRLTDEQREKLNYIREYHKQRTAAEQHERHQADAKEHEHLGEEEHYEEIVGSLGEINDEGCEDLSGVRFIAHDIAYEVGEDSSDYTKLAQAMVLGDVFNNPRFKKPYSHK